MIDIKIPNDIWFHVGRFVPDNTLRTLLTLNAVFFNLAMDSRYREIAFENFDMATMRLLHRLKDPHVCKRVRCLKIGLWSPRFTEPRNYPGLPAGVSFQHAMTEVVLHLRNVTDFSVECVDMPDPKAMVPLFAAAWSTFGSTLEKLTLTLDNLQTIFTTPITSKYLKELKIEFTPGEYPEDNETLSAILAPFINKHASSLQVLSIASSDTLRDMGSLFCSLGSFPNLQELDILVDFHRCGLSDPRGLTRLLADHSDTINSVRLRPAVIRGTHWENAEACLVEWMSANFSDKRFLSNIQSLDLRMPITSTHVDLTAAYLHRSVETLTTLSLLDHNLCYEQIEAVVKVLSPTRRLRTLNIQALTLSPQLVDLLAKELPYLEVLNLSVLKVYSYGEYPGYQDGEDVKQHAVMFEEEMRKRLYPNWKLYDIGIYRIAQDPFISRILAASLPSIRSFLEMSRDPFTSRVVAASVPSIRRFFGHEDMALLWQIGGTPVGWAVQ